jgi:uncharacterized protein
MPQTAAPSLTILYADPTRHRTGRPFPWRIAPVAYLHMMKLSEIWIYPVKGAAGIAVEEWPLDEFGLRHDRRWMVVTAGGDFVTQRDRPALGQVQQTLDGDALAISTRAGSVRLPLEPPPAAASPVRIWNDTVAAIDAGADAAALLTAHLDMPVRLMHMPRTTLRQADLRYAQRGDRVSFADGFPLLLITQESLDELNLRLPEPVTMRRFRPNLVIAGASPHEEDGWARIRTGTVECDVVKPCERCVVTTLDPDTGTGGREPLRTLAGYRSWSRKVYFGQNAIHRAAGVVRAGSDVEVLERRNPDPPLL